MSISIKDNLSPKLRKALRKIKDKRPILEAAGAALEGLTIQAFRDASIRPTEWAELSPRTLKAKGGRGNLLIDTPTLIHSIVHITGSDQVEIGTDRAYAAWLQHGTSRMPARPFIPVTESGDLTPKARDAVMDAVSLTINSLFK